MDLDRRSDFVRWLVAAPCRSAALVGAALFASLFLSHPPSSQHTPAPAVMSEEPITPIPASLVSDLRKVALGERLFADARLSRDVTRSCASCHDVSRNGASDNAFDTGLDGAPLPLHTITVFNAALSFRLNWKGSFRTLEEQAEASLRNPRIMGSSPDEVVARLRADPAITRLFLDAYGHPPDSTNLLDALAIYQRSLLTPGSRFDRWLTGEDEALSPTERTGYELFKSLGCVSCHQGVNVGGNLMQRHGIFRPLASPKPEVVRVPSLRNVAVTPPYFHDGSAPTLEDAIRRMGISQLNWTLSDTEVQALSAFLHTLTGTYGGRPVGIAP